MLISSTFCPSPVILYLLLRPQLKSPQTNIFLGSSVATISTRCHIRCHYYVNLSLRQSVDSAELHPISRLACLLTLRQLFLVRFNLSQAIDVLSGGLKVTKIFQQLNGLMPFDHWDVIFGSHLFSCQRTAGTSLLAAVSAELMLSKDASYATATKLAISNQCGFLPSDVSLQKGLSSSAKLRLFLRVTLSASSLHRTATIGTKESWTNSCTDWRHWAMLYLFQNQHTETRQTSDKVLCCLKQLIFYFHTAILNSLTTFLGRDKLVTWHETCATSCSSAACSSSSSVSAT